MLDQRCVPTAFFNAIVQSYKSLFHFKGHGKYRWGGLLAAGVIFYAGTSSLYPDIPIPVTRVKREITGDIQPDDPATTTTTHSQEKEDPVTAPEASVIEETNKQYPVPPPPLTPAEALLEVLEPEIKAADGVPPPPLTPAEALLDVLEPEIKVADAETRGRKDEVPEVKALGASHHQLDSTGIRGSATEEAKLAYHRHVPYLLIGAGTASFAAYRAIKSSDPTAKILIVGEENRLPYMRPPLSKELWYPPPTEDNTAGNKAEKSTATAVMSGMIDGAELRFRQWNGRERSLYYEPEQFYTPVEELEARENGGIAVIRGCRVEHIDHVNQVAHLDDGRRISYDKCLIATGM